MISLKLRLRPFKLALLLCVVAISGPLNYSIFLQSSPNIPFLPVGAFLVSFTRGSFSTIGVAAVLASAACSSCR